MIDVYMFIKMYQVLEINVFIMEIPGVNSVTHILKTFNRLKLLYFNFYKKKEIFFIFYKVSI